MSRSEQVRDGMDQYLNLCRKVEEGNFIIALPQIEAEYLYQAREKFEGLKEFMSEQEEDPLILPYIEKIVDALVWDCGIRLVEQKPDELIDLGGTVVSDNWAEEAIESQQRLMKYGYKPRYIYKA